MTSRCVEVIDHEDPPDRIEMSSWAMLFYDYTQYTTMHGLRNITAATRFILRRYG